MWKRYSLVKDEPPKSYMSALKTSASLQQRIRERYGPWSIPIRGRVVRYPPQ